MPSTVCSYPMVSSTWSCPKASMSLMCFQACNWTVCWYRSMGAMGTNAPTLLSEEGHWPPPSPPLVVCTGLMCCMYWTDVLYVLDYFFLSHSTYHIMPDVPYSITFFHLHTHNYPMPITIYAEIRCEYN